MEKLYAKLNKSEFWLPSMAFLGHIVSKYGVAVDPCKIEVVLKWERPMNVPEVHSFLGLTTYYMRFVEGYFKIKLHLTRLTQKEVKFVWSDICEKCFQELKKRLTTASVLTLHEGNEDFVVFTDDSHVKGKGHSICLQAVKAI
ncbi:uncharacterized protein LOC110007842 [Amborella trichopoda]|uniref:uncharacterized protein LOC110007842 n=1 Tax=Amborella trichopoda TaxID=13333 RepID=UPI0009BEF169|nr:uncharacterized protein LOC110007842 [Amborella trichopoda]|eukprot:XP_020527222.1 uncharacterized protein LOC110007842 [Amborella trichopoda]